MTTPRIRRWRVKAGLVGVTRLDGLGEGVVDFEDGLLGAVVADASCCGLSALNSMGGIVPHGVAMGWYVAGPLALKSAKSFSGPQPFSNEAISMTKRYFTSFFIRRS